MWSGSGGTGRAGSSTEKALIVALERVRAEGGDTELFDGAFLSRLPLFNPYDGRDSADLQRLIRAVAGADGIIVASPGYHGSISGAVKNVLDSLEALRDDARPYFHGRPVGAIVTAYGSQAAGTTLMAGKLAGRTTAGRRRQRRRQSHR